MDGCLENKGRLAGLGLGRARRCAASRPGLRGWTPRECLFKDECCLLDIKQQDKMRCSAVRSNPGEDRRRVGPDTPTL